MEAGDSGWRVARRCRLLGQIGQQGASLAIHGSLLAPAHSAHRRLWLHKPKRGNLTKLASLANLPCSGYWGSLGRPYILVEAEDELWLIDQHAAHERILYERFLTGLQSRAIKTQALLVPMNLESWGQQQPQQFLNGLLPLRNWVSKWQHSAQRIA